MAIPVENVFTIDFDDRYKLAYQGSGKLRNTVRTKTNVVGATKQFNKYGEGIMTEYNRGNDVVAVNADQSKVTATLVDYNYSEYVFMMDINKLEADEKQAIAESAGKATGRREDQIIINALTTVLASGLASDHKVNVAAADQVPMSVDILRDIQQIFDDAEVDETDRCIVLAPQQINDLLGETEVTSSDYNTVKTLVNGEIDTFLSFKFIKIGTRTEGGLPSATYTNVNRTGFAYHKQALGLAIGQDKKSMVDWIAEKIGWLCTTIYSAGAVAIDVDGIVAVQSGAASAE
jgi:hypothetical protein